MRGNGNRGRGGRPPGKPRNASGRSGAWHEPPWLAWVEYGPVWLGLAVVAARGRVTTRRGETRVKSAAGELAVGAREAANPGDTAVELLAPVGLPDELTLYAKTVRLLVNRGGTVGSDSGSLATVDWLASFPDPDGADDPETEGVQNPEPAGLVIPAGGVHNRTVPGLRSATLPGCRCR